MGRSTKNNKKEENEMKHKGAVICLAILGVLILSIMVGLSQGGTSSPLQTLFMLGLLGFFGLLFIIILLVLLIKLI